MSSTSSSPPKKAPPRKPSRRDATDTRGANRLANGPKSRKRRSTRKRERRRARGRPSRPGAPRRSFVHTRSEEVLPRDLKSGTVPQYSRTVPDLGGPPAEQICRPEWTSAVFSVSRLVSTRGSSIAENVRFGREERYAPPTHTASEPRLSSRHDPAFGQSRARRVPRSACSRAAASSRRPSRSRAGAMLTWVGLGRGASRRARGASARRRGPPRARRAGRRRRARSRGFAATASPRVARSVATPSRRVASRSNTSRRGGRERAAGPPPRAGARPAPDARRPPPRAR